jgi:hypothetical protein
MRRLPVLTGRKPSPPPLPHDERRLAAVGRRLEDVVDGEQAAGQHELGPCLVVGHRHVERVAAVDEQQPTGGPVPRNGGESPTAAITVLEAASSIVRRKNGSVSMRPVSGSTTSGSWCSHPAWFSSEPRWWSTLKSTVPPARAAAPRYTADFPQ